MGFFTLQMKEKNILVGNMKSEKDELGENFFGHLQDNKKMLQPY